MKIYALTVNISAGSQTAFFRFLLKYSGLKRLSLRVEEALAIIAEIEVTA